MLKGLGDIFGENVAIRMLIYTQTRARARARTHAQGVCDAFGEKATYAIDAKAFDEAERDSKHSGSRRRRNAEGPAPD